MTLLTTLFSGGSPVEALTTWAPNRLPPTSFFDLGILEVSANNNKSIVLGATAALFTADLTVSAGHNHVSSTTRIKWRQIASFPMLNNADAFPPAVGSAPNEAFDSWIVNAAGPVREKCTLRLFLNAYELTDLIPRVRASNDNSATTNCNIQFDFYQLDLTTLVATYTLTFSTATLRDRAWVDGVTQDLTGAAQDATIAGWYPLVVVISANLDAATEPVAIHEIAFGVTPI